MMHQRPWRQGVWMDQFVTGLVWMSVLSSQLLTGAGIGLCLALLYNSH
jgi:hypothetical protein